MRRAGFSSPVKELEEMVQQGFEATLDELLMYEQVDDSQMEADLAAQDYQFTRVAMNGRTVPNTLEMREWWLFRMINSRRQLLEKMAYFWHDHFATSVLTVRNVQEGGQAFMMIQNDLFREHALGNFKELIQKIARDPAMLVWLDNLSNVKQRPNENWGRELLELFTLGIGNYTDEDVIEAARAFTGWSLERGQGTFLFRPGQHDYGDKTFLGVTGPFDGDEIVDIIFEQDATSEFIARKLFEFFVYANPSQEVVSDLAGTFRESGYEIRPLVRAILEHPEFYSLEAYRAKIKSPIELVTGTFRELELPQPFGVSRLMTLMGQDLFAPPDVGGWTTGVGWINTATLLSRYNFFNILTTLRGARALVDVEALIAGNGLQGSFDVVDHLLESFVQDDVSIDTEYVLEEYLRTDDDGVVHNTFDISDPVTIDKKVRGLMYLVLVLPVYQLN